MYFYCILFYSVDSLLSSDTSTRGRNWSKEGQFNSIQFKVSLCQAESSALLSYATLWCSVSLKCSSLTQEPNVDVGFNTYSITPGVFKWGIWSVTRAHKHSLTLSFPTLFSVYEAQPILLLKTIIKLTHALVLSVTSNTHINEVHTPFTFSTMATGKPV